MRDALGGNKSFRRLTQSLLIERNVNQETHSPTPLFHFSSKTNQVLLETFTWPLSVNQP